MPIKEHNFSQQELDIIVSQADDSYTFDQDGGDYVRLTVFNQNNNLINIFENISVYQTGDNIYVKPNEILYENQVPEGNYKLQFDFLNTYSPDTDIVVKQISPSRLEVRLKHKDGTNINQSNFETALGIVEENTYTFDWILYGGGGANIPIVNYAFDPSDDSLILKLYEPLPNNITTLNLVKIEKEVLTTQIEDIQYFSEISRVESVEGLVPISDTSDFIYQGGTADLAYESYSDLSSSLFDQTILNNIISGSDLNLNIDYNNYDNYVFFGSAKQKLTNFKTKVSTIETHLNNISESLSATGVTGSCYGDSDCSGDSTYLKERRKELFDKIQNEINTFTTYERFLYFDGQSYSSASAPGVGKNYAHSTPIAQGDGDTFSILNNHDGFNVVYKHTNDGGDNVNVDLFTGKYYAHEKPFFNYSGSIYLSFLLRGDEALSGSLKWINNNANADDMSGLSLPQDAFYSNDMTSGSAIVGDEWRRFVYQASQSYWTPTDVTNDEGISVNYDVAGIDNWTAGSDQYEILSNRQPIKTGSNVITAEGDYVNLATVITGSGVEFEGSIMPAGELFRMYWASQSVHDPSSFDYETGEFTTPVTSSYMTDIKVTLNDPTNALPFGQIYKTDSTEWTNWYNGLQASASVYDDNNINSLTNNLPKYIKENSDYDELKSFLYMLGDHFDLIRNYIDNYVSFYKRNYQKVDSVPTNLMPILAEHLGWELMSITGSSIGEYLGGSVSSVTSHEDITHNTWRKQLNNLIYLYKSKGTLNSIRALLNVYGYPPDILNVQQMGGSTEEHNPAIITDEIKALTEGLDRTVGNVSYTRRKSKLYSYIFRGIPERTLNFDWWTDNANPETIEFVYKHKTSTNNQEILMSSGSRNQTLWDLRVIPSSNGGISSSIQFRLSNKLTGSNTSNDIGKSAVSMSTDYLGMGSGELWNILLKRTSGSSNLSGYPSASHNAILSHSYDLYVSKQNRDSISVFNAVSMSVGGTVYSHSAANWIGSGSRHKASSSNLFVGRTLSGSLAEFRAWDITLSASKFKQHTLNKFSIVGNEFSSSMDNIIYHFKLNENYRSGSSTPYTIYDANPQGPVTNPTDYSFDLDTDIVTGSLLYGADVIDIIAFSLRAGGLNQANDNLIIINPAESLVGNLSYNKLSYKSILQPQSEPKRKVSSKLEILVSPTNYIDNWIVTQLADNDITDLFGKPDYLYESEYTSLNLFREKLFRHNNVEINTNKFVRSYENIFNQAITSQLKKLIPARSTFNDIGVSIKPNILEKPKIKNYPMGLDYGSPGLNNLKPIIDVPSYIEFINSEKVDDLETTPPIEINKYISLLDSIKLDYNKATIDIPSSILFTDTILDLPKDTTIDIPSSILFTDTSLDLSKDANINIDESITKQMEKVKTHDANLDIDESITKQMEKIDTRDANLDIDESITKQMEKIDTRDADLDIDSSIDKKMERIDTHDVSLDIDNIIDKIFNYIEYNEGSFDINDSIDKQMEKIKTHDVNLDINNTIVKTMTKETPTNANINMLNRISLTNSEKIIPITGSIDHINTHYVKSFENLLDLWGTSSNDTHFVNQASYNSGSNSDWNVGTYEGRYIFRSIGDVEVVSGSNNSVGEFEIDFQNHRNFYNREIKDKGKGYTYKSYINVNETVDGPQDGRPMGKTSYYITSSAGDLIYPSNHWIHFDRGFSEHLWEGTQNTDPGFFNLSEHEDLSSASFYRVNVTGDNRLVVQRGKQQKDNDGNIENIK